MTSTLQSLADLARSSDRVAVRSARIEWRFADWFDSARSIARRFIGHGVRVVALAADNSPQWLAVDLAAQLCDVVLVPLPAFFTADQVDYALADSGADAILVDPCSMLGRAMESRGGAVKEPFAEGLQLFRLKPAVPTELPPLTAKISYTSGTTGRPKGVCLARHGMDAVASSLVAALAELDLRRHLCALPLPTLLENVAGVYAPLQSGAEIVVPPLTEVGVGGATQFDPARLLRSVAAFEAQSIIVLPQMLQALVTAIERGAPAPHSLRFVAVGGAHVPSAVLARAYDLGLPVYEGYGLTECGSVVALNTPAAHRTGAVGRPLSHAGVDIDARGDVCVSSPAVCGYVGGSHVSRRFATGDLGHLDADGFLHITGRRKNVFITSFGRNVSPEWVEAELTAEAPIAQAAVFGEARPWNVAVIVPRSGEADASSITAAIDRVNDRLPDYARIGDWCYAAEPFTAANGLATANGRNRRSAVWARYGASVNAVFDGALEFIA